MKLGRLVSAHRSGSDLHIWARSQGKEHILIKGFRPYFYVPGPGFKSITGEEVAKVYVSDPSQVPNERSRYRRHYEADIPYVQRFLIDRGIKKCLSYPFHTVRPEDVKPAECDIPLRVLYLDIEVKAPEFPDPELADYPIISLTVSDGSGYGTLTLLNPDVDWPTYTFATDSELLSAFGRLLEEYDILAGWNVRGFDIPYIENRARKLGVSLPLSSCLTVDMMDAYRFMGFHGSHSLKAAYEDLGLGHLKKYPINEFNSLPPDALAEYNRKDVEALISIDKKLGMIDYVLTLRESVGLADPHPLMNSRLLDPLFLQEAKDRNVVLPSKPEHNERERYKGAVVFDPVPGLHDGVADIDVSRCYPSIILSLNISPETFGNKGDYVVPGYGAFRSSPIGLVPTVVSRLWVERDKLESELKRYEPGTEEYSLAKKRRDAVKFLLNSVYGYLAYHKSRLYNPKLAAAVTSVARGVLNFLKSAFEADGYKVIYGDTDSIFVKAPPEIVPSLISKAESLLSSHFKQRYGAESGIKLSLDKYFSRLLLMDVKKRYAGRVTIDKGRPADYLSIVGFEPVRSDTPPFVRDALTRLIEAILDGGDAHSVAQSIKEEFTSQPPSAIAVAKRIDKKEYKVIPPHVRGAIEAKRRFGDVINPGEKAYMVWTRGGVISASSPDLLDEWKVDVDYRRQYQTVLEAKVQSLLRFSSSRGLDRWL